MRYLDRLAALDPGASLLRPAAARLLLLTGQSSFTSARLSAAQSDFLRAVAPPAAEIVEAAFPFHGEMLGAAAGPPALAAASLRNALQVLWSVASPRYQATVRGTLQQVLDLTQQRLFLVTGSCGLQLANRAWPGLRIPPALAVRVVALGPACFGRLHLPRAELTVLQGQRDGWSRLLYRGPVDARLPCGHLDYWTSREVRERVATLLGYGRPAGGPP